MTGLGRVFVAFVPAGIGGALAFAVLSGLGLGPVAATSVAGTLALAALTWLARRLPADLDGALRRSTPRAVLWALVGVLAVVATARLARFMADETKVESSIYAFDDFYVHHSCLSAYYRAATLQRDGVPNVYERTLYEGPDGEPTLIGNFVTDTFLYPPPFLLLARLGLAISEDFTRWRAVWFGIEGAFVAAALLLVARWIGGPAGRRAALLSALVWLSLPNLTTLQFGNFHLVAIAGSVLAMLALERGRHALGGAALAALALMKIFPGVFVLLLLFQRRWRSLAWTCAFGIVILAASFVVLGAAPFAALVSYHLPRMSTGAALESLFAHPDNIAASHSVFGLVQKLSLLGAPGVTQGTAAAAAWAYGLVLIGAAAVAARALQGGAMQSRLGHVLVWLALVQLASLRAPFTPDTYALFAPLWMLALLLADTGWSGWRPIGWLALIALCNALVPAVEIMPIRTLLAATLVHQLIFLTLPVAIIATLWRRAGSALARSGNLGGGPGVT